MGDDIWCSSYDGPSCSWFVKTGLGTLLAAIVVKDKCHSCGPSTFHVSIASLKRGMGVFIKCKGICAQHIQLMSFVGTYSVVQYSACLGGSEKKLGGICHSWKELPGMKCGVESSTEKDS